MGHNFLRSLLNCQLAPVLGLMNSCSFLRVGKYKLFSLPFCKYFVASNLTWTCASQGGYGLPWARLGRHLLLRSLPAVSSCQAVMRTGVRQYSADSETKRDSTKESDHSKQDDRATAVPQRLSLFKRFKQMYRDYWYVLIPVHVVTSIGWFGTFYYMCVSGVDVVAALESLNVSEKIINPLRDSKAGYVALSYALYKIATPLRYTVTLGGTTVSINYLKKWGYIKPIPPREKLKEMYDEKKENLMERKEALKDTAEQLKERSQSFVRSYRSKK